MAVSITRMHCSLSVYVTWIHKLHTQYDYIVHTLCLRVVNTLHIRYQDCIDSRRIDAVILLHPYIKVSFQHKAVREWMQSSQEIHLVKYCHEYIGFLEYIQLIKRSNYMMFWLHAVIFEFIIIMMATSISVCLQLGIASYTKNFSMHSNHFALHCLLCQWMFSSRAPFY